MKPIVLSLYGGGEMRVTLGGDGLPVFDLSAVTPAVLAHGLSLVNRFSGQTAKPFSDAEHSVNLADWLAALGHGSATQQYALIHDASECLGFGDPHGGIKKAFGSTLREAEHGLLSALEGHLGLGGAIDRRVVTLYDHLIGDHEANQFWTQGDLKDEAFALVHPQPPNVQFWCPELAERRWLRTWERLS